MTERVLKTISGLIQPKAAGWSRRLSRLPVGWCICIGVVVLVGARVLWAKGTSSASRVQEVSKAFSSIGLLYGQPQSDSLGKRVAFVQQGDKALTVCWSDTATGAKQVVYEEYDPWVRILRAWPWSPDDKHFVYSKTEKLVVCAADSGQSAEIDIAKDAVTELVWLTADEFIYVNGGRNLRSVKRQLDGQWKRARQYDVAYTKGNIASLVAVATNAVAWLQDNMIWRLELSAATTNQNIPSVRSNAPVSPPKADLVLWLDATTVKQKDGAAVNWLTDLSSNQNHAVAERITPPTFNGPESAGALNGKGTLHFVSANPATNSAGLKTRQPLPLTGAAPRSVFVVMRRSPDRQMLINMGTTGTNATYYGICEQNDYAYLPAGWNTHDNRLPKLPANEWRIWEAIYDGVTVDGYINGGLKGTKKLTMNTGLKELEIGIRSPNGEGKLARGSDGDFAELLVYQTALPETQRQSIRNYLHAKWFGDKAPPAEASRDAVVWFDPKLDGLSEFSYAPSSGQAAVSRAENGAVALWRFTPGKSEAPVRVLRAAPMQNLRWSGGTQWAFTTRQTETCSVLMLADVADGGTTPLFVGANVSRFTSSTDGAKFTFIGTVSNEISDGVWQGDLASKALHCVVPSGERAAAFATRIAELHGTLTLTNGRRLDYYLYPPAGFRQGDGKKYPLVLGNTMFVNGDPLYQGKTYGPLWVQALASGGAFVAVVDRRTWFGGIEQWGENILGIYQGMVQNPAVDKQRVFLFASSAETQYLSELLSQQSRLWKGVMLLNPSSLPDLSKLPPTQTVPKCLISLGALEGRNEQLKRYKTEAINHGMQVEYLAHEGATHWLQAKPAVRERTDAMLRFVLEN